jgi:predicted  nucleic acid-binding Zn-ribbon protein
MPHQCLKCGLVFEEGSSQLLKGCPTCGGNRFFYTKEPLTEQERSVISQDVEKDITSQIMDLIGEKNPDVFESSNKRVRIKTKELRKAVEKLSEDHENQEHQEKTTDVIDDNYRAAILEKLGRESDRSDEPGTIEIEKPGEYTIDLKGLLEKEPIIIQKDGSYTIHLPSIFKMIDKEK